MNVEKFLSLHYKYLRSPSAASIALNGMLRLIFSILFLACPSAQSSTLNLSHVIGNHQDDNGVTVVTLSPDPVQLLSDPTQAFMTAMTNSKASADWWGTTINTFNWTGSLSGAFVVDVYNAEHTSLKSGGAEFLLHYERGNGDPAAADLFWIQVVDTNKKNGGESIPYPDVYFSGYPNGSKLPFFFRPDETEIDKNPYVGRQDIRSGSYHLAGNEYIYDMAFWDFPSRYHDADWTGELFLASFDQPHNFVQIYDGVKWGFSIVPEPSTLSLLIIPILLLMGDPQIRKGRSARWRSKYD